LDFYSASSLKKKQQSTGRHVDALGHIILIPSQPVFALTQQNQFSFHDILRKQSNILFKESTLWCGEY